MRLVQIECIANSQNKYILISCTKQRFLRYDPDKRISAQDALAHPYFTEFHQQYKQQQQGQYPHHAKSAKKKHGAH